MDYFEELHKRRGMKIIEKNGRPFLTNDIIEEYDENELIPGPLKREVVLIMNPRNRVGPKHIYTPESFPNSLCNQFNMSTGTSTLRVSKNLDDCHEIVKLEEFDEDEDIFCKSCVISY